MNDYDQRNLEFLLAMGDGVKFDEFVQSIPLDDVHYAIELLQKHATKILVQQMEASDNVENVSQAMLVLTKIKGSV